jgi:hypothetical protein
MPKLSRLRGRELIAALKRGDFEVIRTKESSHYLCVIQWPLHRHSGPRWRNHWPGAFEPLGALDRGLLMSDP